MCVLCGHSLYMFKAREMSQNNAAPDHSLRFYRSKTWNNLSPMSIRMLLDDKMTSHDDTSLLFPRFGNRHLKQQEEHHEQQQQPAEQTNDSNQQEQPSEPDDANEAPIVVGKGLLTKPAWPRILFSRLDVMTNRRNLEKANSQGQVAEVAYQVRI